ncbi:MAG: hypothetical protein K6G83_09465 [Lachnospiraceae bacterium]|nr:hypothetical protein [Lachnospiraceae bacterium]
MDRIKIQYFISILILSSLLLSGCDATRSLREHYTKDEAEAELKTGQEKMDEWIKSNCPNGKALSMENNFRELPNGPVFLSGQVTGEFTDGRKTYDYILNLSDGELYLEPGPRQSRAFYKECSALVSECLGVDEFITDKEENSDLSFCLSMGMMPSRDEFNDAGADTEDSLKDGATQWALSKEYKLMRLPAELVLSGGDVKEYVRDKDRKDFIFVSINTYVPEGTDISAYSMEQLKSIEKEYGIYFDELTLQTDDDMMSIVSGTAEDGAFDRQVEYEVKEKDSSENDQ